MGTSILEVVLNKLREAKFTADAAFPGQDGPVITDTLAAVHIERVDRARMSVTVGVHVICPGSRGGTGCELEALRAAEVLRGLGADCIQNGCRYDGDRRAYAVEVLATFTGIAGEASYEFGPGFRVFLGNIELKHVSSITAALRKDRKPEYAIGEGSPVGWSRKPDVWELTLEERYPAGIPETGDSGEPFTLRVVRAGKTETYRNCLWDGEKRQLTREGLLRIRTGSAPERMES